MQQENSEFQKEVAHSLAFQYLTGNWENMTTLGLRNVAYPDADFLASYEEKNRKQKDIAFLNSQLLETDFSFQF